VSTEQSDESSFVWEKGGCGGGRGLRRECMG
jgi:hypothetical protein